MNLRKLLDEDVDLDNLQKIPNLSSTFTKPVVGISRDGVINYTKTNHVTRPEEFEPIPGAAEAVALIRSKGYRIIIFSNQYGIQEGKLTPAEVEIVNQRMLEIFGEAGCTSIDGIYYSTTLLKEDIYSLPNVGMFQRAEREHAGVKFKDGWFVGDKISDIKAAENIRTRPVLIKTGDWEATIKKLDTFANRDLRKKTQVFDTLMLFAESLP